MSVLVYRDRRTPETHWLVTLAKLTKSRFNKKKKKSKVERSRERHSVPTSDLCMHMQMLTQRERE